MAELGLAVTIITLVGYGMGVAKQINEYSSTSTDVPQSLAPIKAQLPLLFDALRRSVPTIQAGRIGQESHKILQDVVSECRTQVNKLEALVHKILPLRGDSSLVRTQKALVAMRSEKKLNIIKGNLQSYIALMTLHHVIPDEKIMDEGEAQEVIDAREKVSERWWWGRTDIEVIRSLLDRGADVNWYTRGGWPLLHRVANHGDYPDIAQLLLDHGADPTLQTMGIDDGDFTALYWAAEFGRPKMIELFLERDEADKLFEKKHYDYALSTAAKHGNTKAVAMLLEHDRADPAFVDSWGRSVLLYAASTGNSAIVRLLLDRGAHPAVADKDGNTPIFEAVKHHRKEVVELLGKHKEVNVSARNKEGMTLLHEASDLEVMEMLLGEFKANPSVQDSRGLTPLHLARGEPRVTLLLKHGADPTMGNKDGETPLFFAVTNKYNGKMIMLPFLEDGRSINVANKHGITPLHRAAKEKAEPEALMLLNYKADPDTLDNNGQTPLLIAAANGCFRLARKLLQLGCKAEIKDPEGNTPLSLAAANGHEEVVKLLLNHKVDRDNANRYGETPLDRAEEKGHKQIIKLLEDMTI